MAYIVFDLEWNQPYAQDLAFVKKANSHVTGEIIQIGAVRLNEDLEVEDTFNELVKPKFLTRMHRHVSSLTGITSADLKRGKPFTETFKSFVEWCGPNPKLITWGVDDMVILKQNLRLHHIKENYPHEWYDGQRIYSYQVSGTADQISLTKAAEERGIALDLTAHNALNDALYTVKIVKHIKLLQGIKDYHEISLIKSPTVIFPHEKAFVIYENFTDKGKALRKNSVRYTHCPICKKPLLLTKMERINGERYMSLGSCDAHGDYVIQWRAYKYLSKEKKTLFYITKAIYDCNEELEAFYLEKAEANRIKEERYLEKLAELEAERLALAVDAKEEP